MALSFTNEVIAVISAIKFKTNMPVYAIYSLIEFGVIALYFNYSIDVFRRKNLGYFIGFIGISLGTINIVFIQGLNKMNSYFMIFEGITIIGMGLYSFLRMLQRDEKFRMHYFHHFWLTTTLVFFWSVTLVNWSLYNYFLATNNSNLFVIDKAIVVFNVFVYIAIASIFLLLPFMQKRYAR